MSVRRLIVLHYKNKSDMKCRFNFPFEPCSSTKLEFEPIRSKDKNTQYKAKIITKRNYPSLKSAYTIKMGFY